MIDRIDEEIEMEDLPTWLQELWEQNPSLARRAEKHYLELKKQCNMGRSKQLCGKPSCSREKMDNSPLCSYHWDIANG